MSELNNIYSEVLNRKVTASSLADCLAEWSLHGDVENSATLIKNDGSKHLQIVLDTKDLTLAKDIESAMQVACQDSIGEDWQLKMIRLSIIIPVKEFHKAVYNFKPRPVILPDLDSKLTVTITSSNLALGFMQVESVKNTIYYSDIEQVVEGTDSNRSVLGKIRSIKSIELANQVGAEILSLKNSGKELTNAFLRSHEPTIHIVDSSNGTIEADFYHLDEKSPFLLLEPVTCMSDYIIIGDTLTFMNVRFSKEVKARDINNAYGLMFDLIKDKIPESTLRFGVVA